MIALDLSPAEEAQISTIAQQIGLPPADYVKKLVKENLPPVQPAEPPTKNAAAIALLESWIADAPTDPEEIRQAEAERSEFLDKLNNNRIESGERPLFP